MANFVSPFEKWGRRRCRFRLSWHYPGITVAPPLKNFHIMILILFYTNLGIAIIFELFCLQNFSKINKRTPTFIPESRVYNFRTYYFPFTKVEASFLNLLTRANRNFKIPKLALLEVVLDHFCWVVKRISR